MARFFNSLVGAGWQQPLPLELMALNSQDTENFAFLQDFKVGMLKSLQLGDEKTIQGK